MFYDGLLMKDFLHWHLFCDNNVFIFPTFLFGFCILISFKQQMTQQCCFAHYKVTRHVSELKKRQNIIFNATFNRVTILIRNMWNPCHFSISFNFSDQAAYITYLMLLYLPWFPFTSDVSFKMRHSMTIPQEASEIQLVKVAALKFTTRKQNFHI